MNILSPSILSADFTILGEELKVIDEAGSEYIHIDVMDGIFVPSISYGMPVIKSIRKATKKVFDVHLMITEPERYINEFTESGADIITFHVEATKKADECIEKIHALGKKAGISLNPGTPVDAVKYPMLYSFNAYEWEKYSNQFVTQQGQSLPSVVYVKYAEGVNTKASRVYIVTDIS